jgi:arylsulfatase A
MNTILVFRTAILILPLSNGLDVVAKEKPDKKPDILIILADDLGYGDVQCYNPERGKIPTPNIDRLAAQGIRFTDAHSSSGVCSPSRYALLTGRYHWRTKLQSGIVGVFGGPLIAPDRLTIAGLAGQNGYRTACIGKWHLGWGWPVDPALSKFLNGKKTGKSPDDEAPVATAEHQAAWRDIFSKPISEGPTTRGFGSYFGTDVPNWPPYCFIENDQTIGIPTEFLPSGNFKNNLASLPGPALKDWKLENILPTLGNRAAKFINEASKSTKPFLLYLPLTAPHTPLAVNEPWRDKSGLNTYADFVMETDAIVGQVIDALQKSGKTDNTIVIFTSDNGCAPYIGADDLEKKGHFPSGPFRGYKSDVWEGGHRVPFIVRWPGITKSGSICGQLVHHADLMATFAGIFRTKLPENAGEDSFNLLPLLRGKDKPVRENSISCSSKGVPGIRSGSWKLIPASGSGGWSKGDSDQPIQLYNLADDPAETNNLASAHPERVAGMKALLEKLITDGRSTPGAVQQNDVNVRRYPVTEN